MLREEADSVPGLHSGAPPPVFDGIPVPDPDVVDNARFRLASRYPSGVPRSGDMHGRPMDDARAVSAVIDVTRPTADQPSADQPSADQPSADQPSADQPSAGRTADALDVGAGLVLLGNLRLYIDRLEADLLDAAEQVDLSWDLIAAILGVPAEEARIRHRALRARQEPQ